jgi:hypothetical protein
MKQTARDRAKLVDEAIEIVWGSLYSHLGYTHQKHHDNPAHHKRCVKEYSKLIKILSELY